MTKRKLSYLHPAWEIAGGVALLLMACFLFWLLVSGLTTGEIIRCTWNHPGVVARKTNAHDFWVSAMGIALLAGILGWLSTVTFRDVAQQIGRKKIQQEPNLE